MRLQECAGLPSRKPGPFPRQPQCPQHHTRLLNLQLLPNQMEAVPAVTFHPTQLAHHQPVVRLLKSPLGPWHRHLQILQQALQVYTLPCMLTRATSNFALSKSWRLQTCMPFGISLWSRYHSDYIIRLSILTNRPFQCRPLWDSGRLLVVQFSHRQMGQWYASSQEPKRFGKVNLSQLAMS